MENQTNINPDIQTCIESLQDLEAWRLQMALNRLTQIILIDTQNGTFKEGVYPYCYLLELFSHIVNSRNCTQ